MKMSVIREYVHLAQSKNFTRTAEEFYIAQSALSRHIAGLESELGVKLINRDRNHFKLTPAGEMTLEEFQKILATYEGLVEKLSEQDREIEGALNLGFLYYDRDYYVTQICKCFFERYPKIYLKTHSGQPQELEEMLFSGQCDAVIDYGATTCERTDIEALPFLKISYYLIYNVDHRFASQETLTSADFVDEMLMVPARPLALNGTSKVLDKVFRENGIRFAGTVPILNFDEVPLVMAETDAIYLSPMANPKAYGPDTASRDFMPDALSCDVSLIWRKDNDNPAIPLLGKAIRSCYP